MNHPSASVIHYCHVTCKRAAIYIYGLPGVLEHALHKACMPLQLVYRKGIEGDKCRELEHMKQHCQTNSNQ